MAEDGLYQKYRPKKLSEVVGQGAAISVLESLLDKQLPRALLFSGPSGTGKTTLARIVAKEAGCDLNGLDFQEVNCGLIEPIEKVRQIEQTMRALPAAGRGRARVWILDEAQSLSRATHAMQGMLKVLENGPGHAYFFLCTTEPQKLLPTIRNRCTKVVCGPIPAKDLEALVRRVAEKEKAAPPLTDRVVDLIVAAAEGSARAALVELERVLGIESNRDREDAISRSGEQVAAFELVKELLPFRGAPDWTRVAKVLDGIKDEDPEKVRHLLLASCRTAMLREGAKGGLAFKAAQALSEPFFDRNSGSALLVAACWKVIFGK